MLLGWSAHYAEDGTPYYYHAQTGESSWALPEALAAASPMSSGHAGQADSDPAGLALEQPHRAPPSRVGGWTEHFADDGTPYYFEASTGRSSWTPPGALVRTEPPSSIVAAAAYRPKPSRAPSHRLPPVHTARSRQRALWHTLDEAGLLPLPALGAGDGGTDEVDDSDVDSD